ncbi:MAG: hypothetical protein IPM20_05055 [Gammaproteobacteria bacterium]|nr:hypothetical protein [Gammaproteobacteria bacterium]
MTKNTSINQSNTQRISFLAVSLTLITVPLLSSGVLGWEVILPLIAIYPGIAAITGWDPVKAIVSALAGQSTGHNEKLAHQN